MKMLTSFDELILEKLTSLLALFLQEYLSVIISLCYSGRGWKSKGGMILKAHKGMIGPHFT